MAPVKDRGSITPLLALAAIGLVAVGIYSNLGGGSEGAGGASAGRAAEEDDPVTPRERARTPKGEKPSVEILPAKVELGAVTPCGDARRFEATIRNTGRGRLEVAGWRSTCGCVTVEEEPGFAIEPGGERTVTVRVEPWGFGGKSQRIDFRVLDESGASNALGARLRVDYAVGGAVRTRPGAVVRPVGKTPAFVDIERVGPDGEFLAEPFEVIAVLPPVAMILPSLGDGHGAIEIDYAAIDALAARPESRDDPAFEWIETAGSGRRWRSFELTVRTSVELCPDLRIRVRN
ncbi:MAG: hypothetical protein RI967_2279 [Planctomycetota bacterium]